MSHQIAECLPSFKERAAGKIEVVAWDQPDPFPEIESTGFTVGGVFVHARNVVSGELRGGVRIRFDVKEGGKSPEAVNVRVIG